MYSQGVPYLVEPSKRWLIRLRPYLWDVGRTLEPGGGITQIYFNFFFFLKELKYSIDSLVHILPVAPRNVINS